MTSRNRLVCFLATMAFAVTGAPVFAQVAAAPSAAEVLAAHSEDEPASAPTERYVAVGDGTVRDNETGLLWADKDNGGDIDWPDAQRYCAAMGPGWDLPSAEDLMRIYDAQRQVHQECIGQLHCAITPLISVTGLTPWTRQGNGDSEAWYVYLADGKPYAYASGNTQGKRALCMHGPS